MNKETIEAIIKDIEIRFCWSEFNKIIRTILEKHLLKEEPKKKIELEELEETIQNYLDWNMIPEPMCSYDRIWNEATSRCQDYVCNAFEHFTTKQ